MSELVNKLLERVAREATTAAQSSGEDCWGAVNRILQRELREKLEAGWGMRYGTSPLRIQTNARWDEAWRGQP